MNQLNLFNNNQIFEVFFMRSNLGKLTRGASVLKTEKWTGTIAEIKKRASKELSTVSPNPELHDWYEFPDGDWIQYAHDYDTEIQACYSVLVKPNPDNIQVT